MTLDEARAFCKAAVEQEVLNTDQVESFTSQVRGGIQSPGAYFMLHAIMKKEQVEKVNKAKGSGVSRAAAVTRVDASATGAAATTASAAAATGTAIGMSSSANTAPSTGAVSTKPRTCATG